MSVPRKRRPAKKKWPRRWIVGLALAGRRRRPGRLHAAPRSSEGPRNVAAREGLRAQRGAGRPAAGDGSPGSPAGSGRQLAADPTPAGGPVGRPVFSRQDAALGPLSAPRPHGEPQDGPPRGRRPEAPSGALAERRQELGGLADQPASPDLRQARPVAGLLPGMPGPPAIRLRQRRGAGPVRHRPRSRGGRRPEPPRRVAGRRRRRGKGGGGAGRAVEREGRVQASGEEKGKTRLDIQGPLILAYRTASMEPMGEKPR